MLILRYNYRTDNDIIGLLKELLVEGFLIVDRSHELNRLINNWDHTKLAKKEQAEGNAGDYVSIELFEKLLLDEEGYIDFLEMLAWQIGEKKSASSMHTRPTGEIIINERK